ncbi:MULTISPECIES: hypothetical protein [unclassified Pseudoalteromonas]|uniref:hypothetical protein n=1 Tax=unclassified Pseudoalteromonas TaxID=194690 RepID=UPI0020973AEE|nr:hypothetical protein [Pseudoalteromonas sp. XMcav2-N]MCO7191050.1 hypothetical protein [Pseudoalteromonas sp. XMcav2-N]
MNDKSIWHIFEQLCWLAERKARAIIEMRDGRRYMDVLPNRTIHSHISGIKKGHTLN